MWWARLLNVISGLLSGGAAAGGGASYESIATVTGMAARQPSHLHLFHKLINTFKFVFLLVRLRQALAQAGLTESLTAIQVLIIHIIFLLEMELAQVQERALLAPKQK